MLNKIKKMLALLRKGKFGQVFQKIWVYAQRMPNQIRARIEDWRVGRMSLSRRIPSRYTEIGAYGTMSSDYPYMDEVFRVRPLDKDAVFVDVGCGEGRVLTYLYLRGFRGKLTGIELDPDVAQTAEKRTAACSNIHILCANALQTQDVIREATALYLNNPFNEEVLSAFIGMVEEVCHQPVTVYYCWDIHRRFLDKRENWTILRRSTVRRPGKPDLFYSIYRYDPPAADAKK